MDMSGPIAAASGDPDNERENKVGDFVVHSIAKVARKMGPVGRKVADSLPKKT